MRDTEPEIPTRALPQAEETRRRRALHQELAVRAGVALLMLGFNELCTMVPAAKGVIRLAALLGFVVNIPYYVAARAGRRRRLQAWIRMVMDVVFITAGLYAAGGLAAAPYLGIYAIVPVYGGIVFSSRACLVITQLATSAYLAMAGAQRFGLLPLRMHAQIERAGRLYAVNEVVAGVTHEMRNVLQSVFGHLWLVRRKLADAAPDVDEHLAQVEDSCEHVMRIIRTTLDMARQPGDAAGPLPVDEVVARVTELKAYDLRRDGITLTVDVPADLPRIRASAFQLQQVLLNVITNAQEELRDRDGRREITVAAAADPLGCVLEVRDSGSGIPRAILPRVFEPFFTTKDTATGLGLAISAGIVERFGGRVTAANRREGGAVLRIILPAA